MDVLINSTIDKNKSASARLATYGVDVAFHHKGISATKPLISSVGKSSYAGEGILARHWALELDEAILKIGLNKLNFHNSYLIKRPPYLQSTF
jgi:hypothetical protein